MWLTRLAVVRPLTVLMGLLGLVIMGGVSYTFLKIDRLPPISVPFVSVSMGYTGATAQDVHRLLVEVQAAVLERTGVLLTPEVRLIGSFEQPDLLRAGRGREAPAGGAGGPPGRHSRGCRGRQGRL